MKFTLILFLLIYSQFTFSQQCDWRPALSEFASFSSLGGDSTCDPLIRETWARDWKSPCDCIQKKDLYTKLKSKSIQLESQDLLDEVDSQTETLVSEAIRSQFINQLEQSVRLDIYLKKGIISTEGNINNRKLSDDFKINIPKNCRIGKISEVYKEIEKDFSCDKDLLKRRSTLLFGSEKPDKWIQAQMGLMERTVMNQLSEKESNSGMCVPYKSYLSLTSSNPKRLTYLKVAKAFNNDFIGFQRWVQDRSDPIDSAKIVGDYELKKKGTFLETSAPSNSIMKLVEPNGSFNRKISSIKASDLEERLDSSVEEISKSEIDELLKSDPIFERMVRDPKFYKEIVEKDKPETINENDPRIIKLISESQDRSCQSLYGKPDSKEVVQQVQQSKGRGANTGRGSSQDNQQQQTRNLLTKFLCEKDFTKEFVDDKFISNYLSPALRRKYKGINRDEANFAISDFLYCKGSPKKVENDLTIFDVSSLFSKEIPESDSLNNLVNPMLNPKSDLRLNNEPISKGNKHYQFNTQVCKHIPSECKVSSDNSESSCSISSLSDSIINKMMTAKGVDEILQKEITNLNISDKALRKMLTDSRKLSPEEISTLLVLRQQLPSFQKVKAEGEIKAILGISADVAINEEYYLKNKNSIDSNLAVSQELLKRLGWAKADERSKGLVAKNNLTSEKLTDETSSYFSNYFALGDSSDEERVSLSKKGKPAVGDIGTPGRSIASASSPSGPSSISDTTVNNSGSSTEVIGDNGSTVNNSDTTYKRKSFRPTPKEDVRIVETVTPVEVKPDPLKKEDVKVTTEEPKNEVTIKPKSKLESSQLVLTSNSDSSYPDTSRFFNGSNNSVYRPKDKPKDTSSEEQELKRLQDRLDSLNGLADELGKSREDIDSNSRMDEIKRLTDEIKSITNNKKNIDKINNIRNRANSIVSDRRNSDSSSGFNGFSDNFYNGPNNNSGSSSEFNPYDPMDRGTSGRREPIEANSEKPKDDSESSASAAPITNKGAGKEGATGGSGTLAADGGPGGGGVSSGKTLKTRGRYPATDNNEEDPDDLCGFNQQMDCIFEYASIYNIPFKFPSLQKFIEYLQIHGRSFKAIEVIKRRGKPTRYIIHEFEPDQYLTREQKEKNYAIIKKMLKNYSANYKKLSEIAGKYIVVNKTEISKQDAKLMQKIILRYADLNKLIDRRLRED